MNAPLLEVQGLKKYFPIGRSSKSGAVKAVDDVNLTLYEGETLGIVGESGCGKSTVGRLVLRLLDPTGGDIRFGGKSIGKLSQRQLRPLRKDMQCVFQDPYASLNPRMSVGNAIAEPLVIQAGKSWKEAMKEAESLLETVGLSSQAARLYPHEFSGGQRQRIAIARAISLSPKMIVADEAVSALDVSIQAQIVNLLGSLQERTKVSYLFISHNLSIVRNISDRVAVMYLGRVVETASRDQLFTSPKHPYTQALLSSVPEPDVDFKRERIVLSGEVPNAANPPSGCPFHPRCPHATDRCRSERPEFREVQPGHYASCHFI
ncbi:ATP-binding cassette domain-containing protein [Paenibacillus hemerocallicola]|jgi:peptide/nickel transport system ATP-binding protein/oligopeptide transport system ATP-binding protein|uniref:ATP-binding cassette domain-containing protein n=1 Tax=Paenibacillus hemerocallicola TaxID=1172614 RepID=A0A5C4TAS7_9BACL|nr:oligopeptide/dipeptide ABC transporter ATP-binding protein [Paenibacillus hemerocallicola]TNJ65539.1 ATP-binding cassette domain-containing protein [Paenibacillus hemerocallicola]